MECNIEEVGISHCPCAVCVHEWNNFLRWTRWPAKSPRPIDCLTDPDCECSRCVAGRERVAEDTLQSLLKEDYRILQAISNSAGYCQKIVAFELVNGNIWCFDYRVGEPGDTPVLVVPCTARGVELLLARFDCYL
jgi:hypothetical protein